MKMISNINDVITFEDSCGRRFVFTRDEVRSITVSLLFENLKEDIAYNIDEMDGDEIDLTKPYITREAIEKDAFDTLSKQVRDLFYPNNETIYFTICESYAHLTAPELLEDEIAEILDQHKGESIYIGPLHYRYYSYEHDKFVVFAIYEALEKRKVVTVGGVNILDLQGGEEE